MILTVVPNPALDKTVVIPGFNVGQTYRAEVLTLAGGKGFNMARALRTLGHESLVIAPLGGHAGQYLRDLAVRDGLQCDGLERGAELRTCLTIVDPQAGYRLTEVYEQGAPLEPGDWERLVELATRHFEQARFLAVCGSFPSGMPEGGLYQLVQQARVAGLPALLDTYGPQVARALELQPSLLKVNQHEAGSLLEREITTVRQALEATRELQKRGAGEVVITLGNVGAVGLTAEGKVFGWVAPQVAAVSAIGSGDCLLAGIIAGQERGERLPEATRFGIAAGAANTLQIGAGRLELRQVEELLPQVRALPLD
ncbi:MAG: hexose kinase [Ktedonobacteraceae bacterium]|nr:hexose kinase [Ktedonobacteraceae bacterium]MBO0794547.1 hexose kinase [Ktedonobacteraceae bacterium]